MRTNRKENLQYYCSVEGQTEKWYFEWLSKIINQADLDYTVSIDAKVQKNPYKYAKTISLLGKCDNHTNVFHISDYEGSDENHIKEFKEVIDNINKANNIGKTINYYLGYSNLTFELWIIIHKNKYKTSLYDRHKYYEVINKFFCETFKSNNEFKKEDNFKRCLNKLTIDDVVFAVNNAIEIMNDREQYSKKCCYNNFEYYDDNPALKVHEFVGKILQDCGNKNVNNLMEYKGR